MSSKPLSEINRVCPECGSDLPATKSRGKRRIFCSENCKQDGKVAQLLCRPNDLLHRFLYIAELQATRACRGFDEGQSAKFES